MAALTAQHIVNTFARAGLVVPNARDNSRNCEDLGCIQLITTDAISVYQWPNTVGAKNQAQVLGNDCYRIGNFVLSYGAARTPKKNRLDYERALKAAVNKAG